MITGKSSDYPIRRAIYALRESLTHYLHAFRGVNCRPEQVMIGAGTEYLLGLIIQILGADRLYAVENPGYAKTSRILLSHERDVCLIGLDEDGISMPDLVQSGANTVYVTPSHHYPLGLIMPVARRMQLLAWAGQSVEHYIIEDDYDSEFRFSGRPVPALQGLDTQNKSDLCQHIFQKYRSIHPDQLYGSAACAARKIPDELWVLRFFSLPFRAAYCSTVHPGWLF